MDLGGLCIDRVLVLCQVHLLDLVGKIITSLGHGSSLLVLLRVAVDDDLVTGWSALLSYRNTSKQSYLESAILLDLNSDILEIRDDVGSSAVVDLLDWVGGTDSDDLGTAGYTGLDTARAIFDD